MHGRNFIKMNFYFFKIYQISSNHINVNFPFSLVNQQTASPYLSGRHTQRKLFNPADFPSLDSTLTLKPISAHLHL